MSTVNNVEPRIKEVRITEDEIIAHLVDGRTISVPLTWSWRLSEATEAQINNYKIIGDGIGIHWPDVDEDISAQGMLMGTPAKPPKQKEGHSRLIRLLQILVFRSPVEAAFDPSP
jgi:hypothetical protein